MRTLRRMFSYMKFPRALGRSEALVTRMPSWDVQLRVRISMCLRLRYFRILVPRALRFFWSRGRRNVTRSPTDVTKRNGGLWGRECVCVSGMSQPLKIASTKEAIAQCYTNAVSHRRGFMTLKPRQNRCDLEVFTLNCFGQKIQVVMV